MQIKIILKTKSQIKSIRGSNHVWESFCLLLTSTSIIFLTAMNIFAANLVVRFGNFANVVKMLLLLAFIVAGTLLSSGVIE